MKTSEQIDQIAVAFVKAQATIKAVVKDKTGKIQGKDGKQGYEYMYSDLASVIDHVKGPLNENGIAFVQTPERAEGGVTVATRFIHISGQWFEGETFIPVSYGTPQAYGSAITYCKRYGLQAMSGLPSEDDDGERATRETVAERAAEKITASVRSGDYSQRLVARCAAKPITATQHAHDTLAEQTPEEQAFLREKAIEIIAEHEAKRDVYQFVEKQHFDTEQKLALWSLLPSNVRSAIKKQRETSLGSQP